MQEREQIRSLNGASEATEVAVVNESLISPIEPNDQGFCEITNRILIISPRPASLRSLVAELADKCYDVLLLHHADDPLLNMVQGNIIVVDRTAHSPSATANAWPSDGSSPVLALINGADSTVHPGEETVQWPGSIEQVIAKIQQLSLKYTVPIEESRTYVFKDVVLDPDRMTVTRNGSRVELTKTEYDLLRTIIAADGKVLTRQELMNEVWGEQYFGGSNAVDVHIRSLRSKLEDDPKEPRYIATVRGAGYRLADL
ncbi:winged helix-turn-helix domain-containing protein [Cohnella cholangitidis]|uniref:Winged helix-turn-helix transcriptional regulator n=1 Tax=Cohnella cholangitidis TaxID=2598458 RepID=A0A7G5C1P5_9BACL|nr:winged helix-turn-helix domain-containing protein [Cohnella cholangitidis]QMV43129.1 winged helix-turn-helix transcriptional regulator [Cohnella cholangitidis]